MLYTGFIAHVAAHNSELSVPLWHQHISSIADTLQGGRHTQILPGTGTSTATGQNSQQAAVEALSAAVKALSVAAAVLLHMLFITGQRCSRWQRLK